MIESGAYDDLLRFAGLATSEQYNGLDDPESTWLSRTLADTADPDYAQRWLEDTYLRAGGDPNGAAARAAGAADIIGQFVIPAEEIPLAAIGKGFAAANRGRAAWAAARELGASGREARKVALAAAVPVGKDAVQAANDALRTTVTRGIAEGTLDPNKIGRHAKRQVAELFREAGVANAEGVTDELLASLADRHAAVLDTAKQAEVTGGPVTQRLRGSTPYRDRERDLDALVRAGNLTPQGRDSVMRFLETAALNAAERGTVATPEEWFARHSWEAAGEPVEEAGALYQGASDEYTAGVTEARARLDSLKADGKSPVEAARILRDELPRQTAGFTDKQRGIHDVLYSRVGKQPRASASATRQAAEDAKLAPTRTAMNDALVALGEERKRIAAEGGQPFDWDAERKYPRLGELQRAYDDAKRAHDEVVRSLPLYSAEGGTVRGSIEAVPSNLETFMEGSAIRNEDGSPRVLYHATSAPEFDTFREVNDIGDVGVHLGDAGQASELAEYKGSEGTRIVPVYANIRNPMRVPDVGDWTPEGVLSVALGYGKRADPAVRETLERVGGREALAAIRKGGDAPAIFRDLMERAGYDGLVYSNDVEGVGRDSYVAFRPEQIKSATANAGTFDPTNPSMLAQRGESGIRGSIAPTTENVRVPNPERAAREAAGKDAADRVRQLEGAEAPNPALQEWMRKREERRLLEQQRDALRRNPRPDDPEWVEDMDAVSERLADLPDEGPAPAATIAGETPELAAARAELATLRGQRVPREIVRPSTVQNFLIRLFRTGDVGTAFHEGSHLIDLMMGEEWTRDAMAALGMDRNAPITRKVREAIADAGARALRGTLRPGSKLANVMEDLRDSISDVWRRVRGVPAMTTPEFRRFWDATLRPQDATLPLAVKLVDERFPGPFGKTVVVSGDRAREISQGAQAAEGRARNATNIMRSGPEVRTMLGLQEGQQEVNAGELLANALSTIATERMRRRWGFGKLEQLTARTAVPAERAAEVKARVAAIRKATLGGDVPRPVDGAFVLNADQQAGMRRMLDDLLRSPMSALLPERLRDAEADLSRIEVPEWNTIADLQLDANAGAGAFRDRVAERAAVSGATALIRSITSLTDGSVLDPWVQKVRDAFVVSNAADEYANPAVRDVIGAMHREIADSARRVKNDIVRIQRGGTGKFEAMKRVAAAMPPEVVPVDAMPTLATVERLQNATDVQEVVNAVPDIHRLFADAPVASTAQTAQERAGLSLLDNVGRRMRDGADFGAAVLDAGTTVDAMNDAMATIQEGIRRRAAAVDNVGTDILLTFAGSPDRAILNGVEPGELQRQARIAYQSWYSGDWGEILRTNLVERGHAAVGPNYDQGTAALNVLIRLEARKSLASFARRMAEVGVVGDTAELLKGGLRYDRPYEFGSITVENRPRAGQQYINDVAHYIQAIQGWSDTHTLRMLEEGPQRFEAPGARTADGTINKAAYTDAQRILYAFGFKTGKGDAWTAIDLPGGGKILMPDLFAKPIQEVLEASAPVGAAFKNVGAPKLGEFEGVGKALPLNAQAINAIAMPLRKFASFSVGMLKTGLTTGLVIPKAGFFVGNFLAGMFQLYQGVGAVDALRIMSRPILPTAEGATVRRVIARMWADGPDNLLPAMGGFFDPAGRWFDDATIADGATRAGLNSSLAKTELTASIIEDINANEPGMMNRIKALPGRWQQFLTEASTATDNYYRIATYVDALKRGVAEKEAADIARRVAFDYNEMTEFERKFVRKGVLFYSYQRRNQDLFWWTLLNHPSRVMGQLRALRGLQQDNLGPDSELFTPEWAEGRFMFDWRPALVEGQNYNANRGAVMLMPRLPVGDAVGLWQSVLRAGTELNPDATSELASKLNPWIQAAFVLPTGVDIHSQRSIEGFNKIPNWLVEMDENLTGGMLVHGLFQATQAQARDPSQQDYPGSPQWIVGDSQEAARAWWLFRNLTAPGAELDTITAMQRIGEPRAGVTEGEELAGWLGFKPQLIPTREEAMGRLQRQREGDIAHHLTRLKSEGERVNY